jgi:RNA polymerase sigma factor (sigma-70 family)
MRQWLLNFARKFLPTQRLRPPLRRPGRPADVLLLEILEDRSVPSTLANEVSSVVYASLSNGVSLSPAGATVTLAEGSVSTTGLSGPGLDRLIQALQQLEPSSTEFDTPTPAEIAFSPAVSSAIVTGSGTPQGDSGGETTNDVSGNSGAPTPPTSSQTAETASGGTSAAADPVAGGIVSAGTPQGASGRGEDNVAAANISLNPIAQETSQPTIPGGALSGPGALQALQPAFPDGGGSLGIAGAAPSVDPEISLSFVPGGTSAASPQSPQFQGADVTTNPLTAPGIDVAISPTQRLPDATGASTRTPLTDLPDGSLLQSFAVNREQSAFTTLVRRHEASVLRVCKQVLGDSDRAQDASQNTFQALARRAGSLDWQAPLGRWLSTVAYHVALRFRANDVRRRQLERAAVAQSAAEDVLDPGADLEKEELRAAVGEELDRLPAKYRVPLVLHYLGGRTHAEVAQEVGLPLGSIARRIEDALGLLRDRLINRGFPF